MFWRLSSSSRVYESCKPMYLPNGVIISHDFSRPVKYIEQAIYHQKCYEGKSPLLNTNVNLVMNTFSKNLPLVESSWKEYIKDSSGGTFIFSSAPIIYSLASSAVVTWFLTIFVITNYTIKPSILLRCSTILASIYMLIVVVKSIVMLHLQQRQGYLSGKEILDMINEKTYINVIEMIATLCLQFDQVQVIMRLFARQSDKRLIFLTGILTSITSQTLWSVGKFHNFDNAVEAGKIIPAFTYLVRIAMSITYAAIFTAFVLTKTKLLLSYPDVWPITLIALLLIYAPVAFFIADVSNAWVYELSEVFSTVTYVICVVIPWEWCNKYNVIRKIQEKEGVLGRKFYEDEMYELDRFELFVEEESGSEDSEGSSTVGNSKTNNSTRSDTADLRKSFSSSGDGLDCGSRFSLKNSVGITQRFAEGYSFIRNGLMKITDAVIATGMAIPRSVSAGSSFGVSPTYFERGTQLNHNKNQHHHKSTIPSENVDGNATNAGRTGDVFVYSTKNVTLNFDES